MKYTLSSPRVALGALIVAAAFTLAARPAPSSHERETARIRAHFDSVLVELESRDLTQLTPTQRLARATHIARLREYRDAGVFPKNFVSAEPTPVFVDASGVHCAMGYLIARSGRNDIVARIATARNLARIPELADDPALVAWLDSAGLSVAEAGRIQPQYGPWEPVSAVRDRNKSVSRDYAIGSGIYLGFSGAIATANALRPGLSWTTAAGATAGMVGFGLAASQMSKRGAAVTLAAVNASVSAVSFATAWRSARANASRSVPGVISVGDPRAAVNVLPIVNGSAVGVGVRLNF